MDLEKYQEKAREVAEEVKDVRKVMPRAILVTLALALLRVIRFWRVATVTPLMRTGRYSQASQELGMPDHSLVLSAPHKDFRRVKDPYSQSTLQVA